MPLCVAARHTVILSLAASVLVLVAAEMGKHKNYNLYIRNRTIKHKIYLALKTVEYFIK